MEALEIVFNYIYLFIYIYILHVSYIFYVYGITILI